MGEEAKRLLSLECSVGRYRCQVLSMLTSFFLALALFGVPQEPSDPVPATLHLEVLRWSDQQPLAGAKVAVHWGLEFIRTADAFGTRTGLSARVQLDAEGRATVEVPHNEELLIYVAPTETTRLARAFIEDTLGSDGKRTLRIDAYPDLIPVSGRVVNRRGEPVAGARVQALWGSEIWMIQNRATREKAIEGRNAPPPAIVTTDGEGRFHFEGLASKMFIGRWRADWVITATAEDLTAMHRLRLVPQKVGPTVEGIAIQLAPTRDVRGTLIAEDGSRIEGAQVTVDQFGKWEYMPTNVPGVEFMHPTSLEGGPFLSNAAGEFVVPGVVEGDWRLKIHTLEDARFHFVEFGASDEVVNLSLVREGENRKIDIVGQVVDQAGDPIEGAQLQYQSWGDDGRALTDAEGRFILPDFLPEKLGFELKCYAPGYAVDCVVLPNKRKDVQAVRFVLTPEQTITGRVLNADGSPCVGYKVLASPIEPDGARWPYWKRNHPQSSFDLSRVTTDENGRFRFTAIWPGEWRIRVFRHLLGGGYLLGYRVIRAGAQEVEISIGDGMTSVRGRLIDAETGLPIREYSVTPSEEKNGHPELKQQVTNEDGVFEFSSLAKGEWSFHFEANGYRDEFTAEISLPAESAPLEFQLGKKTRLRVRVRDSNGAPVPFALLDCRGLNQGVLGARTLEALGSTDEDGYAELANLPKGRVSLLVYPLQSFVNFEYPIDLRESSGAVFNVSLPGDFTSPRQAVELRFQTPDGKDLQRSFQVLARDENEVIIAAWRMSYWREMYSVTPGHELAGYLHELPRTEECVIPFELPVGRFRLSIVGEGFEVAGPEVVVEEGQGAQGLTVTLDLD